jgi:hypothetical protein
MTRNFGRFFLSTYAAATQIKRDMVNVSLAPELYTGKKEIADMALGASTKAQSTMKKTTTSSVSIVTVLREASGKFTGTK